MAVVLTPILVLSVTGLVLSLAAHAAALLGLPQPPGPAASWLDVGVLVVWLPALVASGRLDANSAARGCFGKAALRGCPGWMRWLTYGFFVYGIVGFLLFRAVTAPEAFGGFTGHRMAFYSAAAATLYSAVTASRSAPARRDPGGRPASAATSSCEAGGVDVAGRRAAGSCRPDAEPGAAGDTAAR